MIDYRQPVKVKGERVWRTYLGGRELDRIHGSIEPKDSHFPEEWMLSMTKANNSGREGIEEGLCYLDSEERISLKELIQASPKELLGEKHFENFNTSMGVLIKLIDSKERLTVQAHPDKQKAMELFNSRFGKTECWHILGTRVDSEEPPYIYIGFKQGISREMLKGCFDRQDYDGMLNLMHKVRVKKGETYIIYGGVPHAIGAGCFIMEIQEPTDYTIRIEKVTPSGFVIDDFMCHQGIGFERMFDCFHYEGRTMEEAIAAWRLEPKKVKNGDGYAVYSLVSYDNTSCFKMEKVVVEGKAEIKSDKVFECLYVLQGEGTLSCNGKTMALKPNDQLFVPACSETYVVNNEGRESLELLRCFGPR
jgi:mannose-6-phosphate isomerase